MLMSLHLSVASRLLLNSPQAFNEMVAAVAAEEGKAHAEVAGEEISLVWQKEVWMVVVWLRGSGLRRKCAQCHCYTYNTLLYVALLCPAMSF